MKCSQEQLDQGLLGFLEASLSRSGVHPQYAISVVGRKHNWDLLLQVWFLKKKPTLGQRHQHQQYPTPTRHTYNKLKNNIKKLKNNINEMPH